MSIIWDGECQACGKRFSINASTNPVAPDVIRRHRIYAPPPPMCPGSHKPPGKVFDHSNKEIVPHPHEPVATPNEVEVSDAEARFALLELD